MNICPLIADILTRVYTTPNPNPNIDSFMQMTFVKSNLREINESKNLLLVIVGIFDINKTSVYSLIIKYIQYFNRYFGNFSFIILFYFLFKTRISHDILHSGHFTCLFQQLFSIYLEIMRLVNVHF